MQFEGGLCKTLLFESGLYKTILTEVGLCKTSSFKDGKLYCLKTV